jgi:hypothetical protein
MNPGDARAPPRPLNDPPQQQRRNEIAIHCGVHPNQAPQWKKQAIESLPDVFSTWRERDAQWEEALRAEL